MYKIQGGTLAIFFLEFWSPNEYLYSCQNVDQLLVNLWSIYGHFGDFWGGGPRRAPLTAGGSPRRLRDDLGTIFDGFWPPFGRPGEHFGGHLGARVSNLEGLCRFFGFFVPPKKDRKSYQTSSKKEPFWRRSTWLKCSK